MKVQALKKFQDKITKELREVGDVFECTEERYNEILTVGQLIVMVEEEETPDEDTPDEDTPGEGTPDEGTPDEDTQGEGTPQEDKPDILKDMTVVQLKEHAEINKIDIEGLTKKADILAKIKGA